LPPAPVTGCSSEAFLLGNVVALHARLLSDALNVAEHTQMTEALTWLLSLPAVPEGMLTERQAVTWQAVLSSSGSARTIAAVAVPPAVQEQARLLVSERSIKRLCAVLLARINERRLRRATTEERQAVQAVLSA
ncbi:unnamed protein product, partial [Phaeothamnion confervicola]